MVKRGQITLFIIIGIILLVVVGTLFFFRERIFVEKLERAAPVAERVPQLFEPIRKFTEDCLTEVSLQGLEKLGQQGGYLYFDKVMVFNEIRPTDSDGLMFPGSDMKLLYWRYNKEADAENKVMLASHEPRISGMQEQLEKWVREQISGCLNGYAAFGEQGFQVSEAGELKVTVDMISTVRIAMERPITVVKEGTEATLQHFYVEHPVNMKHMYEIANQIMEAEQNYSFLEKNTLGLITLFGDTRADALMPMTDATFELASTTFWSKTKLKEDIKLILMQYTPLLRYLGSVNFYQFQYPVDEFSAVKQRIYNDMVLPLEGGQDLEVRFNYLDFWEPYFEMNCEGEICRPQSVTLNLLNLMPFGMQRYKGVYDISYPVWVSLYDNKALDGRGYFFNFALEANIRNNRPALDGMLPEPVPRAAKSLLCKEDQRLSGEIITVVRDKATMLGVPGAQVTFTVDDESCVIGVTDEQGLLRSSFPIALGGVVHVLAVNYVGTVQDLDTEAGRSETIEFELYPFKAMNIGVMKKKLFKCEGTCFTDPSLGKGVLNAASEIKNGWLFSPIAHRLRDTERAMVMLKRISDVDDPVMVVSSVIGEEVQPVRLPAGEYEVDMTLFMDEEVVIPEQQRCTKAGDKKQCYAIPEVRMPQFMSGGLKWNGTLLLELEPGSFYNAEELTLFGVSPSIIDIPEEKRVVEDLEQLGKTAEYSAVYKDSLVPRYD